MLPGRQGKSVAYPIKHDTQSMESYGNLCRPGMQVNMYGIVQLAFGSENRYSIVHNLNKLEHYFITIKYKLILRKTLSQVANS